MKAVGRVIYLSRQIVIIRTGFLRHVILPVNTTLYNTLRMARKDTVEVTYKITSVEILR